jgi:hypothetical protein
LSDIANIPISTTATIDAMMADLDREYDRFGMSIGVDGVARLTLIRVCRCKSKGMHASRWLDGIKTREDMSL